MNTDKRIELTQVAQIADQIDYLEALFVDLDGAPESQKVTMAKLRTLGMLAAAYNKAGFCHAAAECLRLSESYFCQWIAQTEQPLNENVVDSLIWNYLALGAYIDARRAARLTADVVGYRLSGELAEKAKLAKEAKLAKIAQLSKKNEWSETAETVKVAEAVKAAEAARLEEAARISRWYNDQFQRLISTHEKSANEMALRVRQMRKSKTGVSLVNEVVAPLTVVPPQAVSA